MLPAVKYGNDRLGVRLRLVEGTVDESRGDRNTTIQLHDMEPEQA